MHACRSTLEDPTDAVLGYGYSKGTYRQQQLLDDRVEAAVNRIVVDPMTGAVRCSAAALAQFPDCVPANLSTREALLNGVLPDNVLNFIRKNTKGDTVYKGLTASAYVTGPLFSLPAGDVESVIGAEWRREEIDASPDPEAERNNYWGFSTAGLTRGEDTVTEGFVEVELPLLKGKRFAESLTFNVSGRFTEYDSYGSDTTYRGALNYQVTPQFAIRSTLGTSFRAPDLYEQFLGDLSGFISNLADPCINYGARLRPGDPVYDNCARQGLATDFAPNEGIESITGGSSTLAAETSNAFTAGIVLKPDFIDISLAVDFFRIEIEDTVESPSEAFILRECYNSTNFSSPFCARVGPRNARGELQFVDASFVNIGLQESSGVDVSFLYEREFPIGQLTFDLDTTYLIEQSFDLFGESTQLAGRWGFPRWSATADLRFDWRDLQFAWFVDFTGESREDLVFDPGTSNVDRVNRTPNVLFHTASVRYRAADWEIIGTVRNVFDKDPPFVSDGQGQDGANRFLNTLPGVGYDLFGRTFLVQVSTKF